MEDSEGLVMLGANLEPAGDPGGAHLVEVATEEPEELTVAWEVALRFKGCADDVSITHTGEPSAVSASGVPDVRRR
jgi:hypothetical protein